MTEEESKRNWAAVTDFDPDFAAEIARICREFEAPAMVFVKGKEKAKPAEPEGLQYVPPFKP